MDNKLLNKVITISAEETKQTQYGLVKKIKDENNLTYSVFQKKRDGSESEAWKQAKELTLGDTVQIGYVSDIKPRSDGSGNYEARTIRNFNKDIGNGSQNYQNHQQATQVATQGSKPASGQNLTPSEVLTRGFEDGRRSIIEKDDLITRQVAFKGVIELMASQIIVEADVEKGVYKWTDKFTRIIKAKELPNPINTVPPARMPDPELPTIQVNEPKPDDGIPFPDEPGFANEDWKFEK